MDVTGEVCCRRVEMVMPRQRQPEDQVIVPVAWKPAASSPSARAAHVRAGVITKILE